MSKKYLTILLIAILMLAVAAFALPGDATASKLLGITATPTITSETPTDTPTDPPTDTPTDPPTDTPTDPPTDTPTDPPTPTGTLTPDTPSPTPESPPKKTPKPPKETEVVLLPATGEFPIDPSQGMQWFFALTIIFVIGFILIRTVRGAKIKK